MTTATGKAPGPSLADAARAARSLRAWGAALRRARLTLAADIQGENGPEVWPEEPLRARVGAALTALGLPRLVRHHRACRRRVAQGG